MSKLHQYELSLENCQSSEDHWSNYFDEKVLVELPEKNLFINVYKASIDKSKTPLITMLLLHGAGASSLSWALFVKEMKTNYQCSCHCVALDMRGHGDSTINSCDDLNISSLVEDIQAVLSSQCDATLPLCVVGHSLGGAIAINLAEQLGPEKVKFLVIVDLTEGNAMASLHSLHRLLRDRPTMFSSMNDAIQYLLSTRQVQNLKSAKISSRGYFKYITDSDQFENVSTPLKLYSIMENQNCRPCCSRNIEHSQSVTHVPTKKAAILHDKKDVPRSTRQSAVKWTVQLCDTHVYWHDWFKGISAKFLNLCIPRILILNDLRKLDKELTIGQMKGVYQLEIFKNCGHALNEDEPKKMADIIVSALRRYKLA